MGLETYIESALSFVNTAIIPFLLGVAFLIFVINVVRFFIFGGANKDSQEKARSVATYSVLAFVFIVIFWGLVNLLASAFGLSNTATSLPACPDYIEQTVGCTSYATVDTSPTPSAPIVTTPDAVVPTDTTPGTPATVDTTPATPATIDTAPGTAITPVSDSVTVLPTESGDVIAGEEFTPTTAAVVTPIVTTVAGSNPYIENTLLTATTDTLLDDDIDDSTKLQTVQAYNQIGLISDEELENFQFEINLARSMNDQPEIDLADVPEPDPTYVADMRLYKTNLDFVTETMLDQFDSPTAAQRELKELFDTSIVLRERQDYANTFDYVYDFSGTDPDLAEQTRDAVLSALAIEQTYSTF